MTFAVQNLRNATPDLLARAKAAAVGVAPADTVRAGNRKRKTGSKQLYRCNACRRRFSETHAVPKRKPGHAVLDALGLVCQGYSYSEIVDTIRHKHRVEISPASVSRWVKEYQPPYLAIRGLNRRAEGRNPIRSHVFVHGGIQYAFRIHLPKLDVCPLDSLKSYLHELPTFIEHSRFDKNDARHSGQT